MNKKKALKFKKKFKQKLKNKLLSKWELKKSYGISIWQDVVEELTNEIIQDLDSSKK